MISAGATAGWITASPTWTPCATTAISGTKKIVSTNRPAVTSEASPVRAPSPAPARGGPGAGPPPHAGPGLYVGGDRRHAHRAAAGRRDRVHQQQLLELRRLTALVEQPARAGDGDRGADGVEEVAHEEHEDHRHERPRERVGEVARLQRIADRRQRAGLREL